ncbi:MAG: hemolysin activation/secretion protein [Pseudanabaena sp.]|nr:MAG: hemolysin activation/secretion protein [Pseudanabaena sp.]
MAMLAIAAIATYAQPIAAQTAPIPPDRIPRIRPITPDLIPKNTPILPKKPSKLPSPDSLLAPIAPQTTPPVPKNNTTETIVVKKFVIIGSTVFSEEELAKITDPYINKPISINELFQVRTKITELYLERGYITSGAFVPEQNLTTGTVKIQIVEGGLEEIKITGLTRLDPNYIRSRIAIATGKPLNRTRLLESLQLLQINPLLESISANLSPGSQPGINILEVSATEAKTFSLPITFDNNSTPSVGTNRRQIQLVQTNLTGLGDRLGLSYINTDGSNLFDVSYTIPFNPYNGTISIGFTTSASTVIEAPFDVLDIRSNYRNYEISIRQPLLQNTSQDFAIGLTANHRQSQASLLGGEIPFPSLGSDVDGKTTLTAIRFFQEYVQRSSEEVFTARSQFSLGIEALGTTINAFSPDGRFFVWRGQSQYVRLLAPDTFLFIRGDLQLADRPLLSQEQITFGGQDTVRGYRQDLVQTDNGLLLSAEVRIPLVRIPEINGLLQFAPFFDFGKAWNHSVRADPDPSTLASVGMGLRFQLSDRFSARLDFGVPLSLNPGEKKTWQENGFYFSLVANPF